LISVSGAIGYSDLKDRSAAAAFAAAIAAGEV